MASEDVRITLKPKSMHVRATFNFVNEGPAQTVTTAFPETIQDQTEHATGKPISILWFKAWVNGRRTPARRLEMKLPQLDEFAAYSGVWLKEISFARKSRRQVVCEYEAKYAEGREFMDATYILRSGATWKGAIGRCDLTIDWRALGFRGSPEITRVHAPIAGPNAPLKPMLKRSSSAMYRFMDLEPSFDINMAFMTSFWNFKVNGKAMEELPIDENGTSGIESPPGDGSDPKCNLWGLLCLLGTRSDRKYVQAEVDQGAFNSTSVFKIHGRPVRLEFPSYVVAHGRRRRLDRPMVDRDAPVMYVRDVVEALGGTYHYDARAKRADIRIKW